MVSQRELYPDWTSAPEVPAVPDVDRHRPVREQHARGARGAVRQAERVRAHAEIRHRARSDEWVGKKYHQSVGIQPIIEVALGLYFTGTVFYALANGIYGTLPFLMLFQVGFLYTGLLSILQQFTGENVMLKAPEVGEESDLKAGSQARGSGSKTLRAGAGAGRTGHLEPIRLTPWPRPCAPDLT